jgi:hypothetical protein
VSEKPERGAELAIADSLIFRYLKAGTVGKNYSNVLVLLLRLRQACCHPHLIQDFEEAAPAGGELSMEAMMELAKNLAPEVIARLLAAEDAFEVGCLSNLPPSLQLANFIVSCLL